jgi:multimeric flavodoxin WrbA
MKKILGIIASPRKLGNCEIAVKDISMKIEEEVDLRILRLGDFNIQSCKACYKCLFDDQCVIEDDINLIHDQLLWADGIILAAPTYFLSVHSSVKTLLDRGLSFYSLAEKLWNKPSIGLAIAGIDGKEGHALLGVESFLKSILSDIKYSDVLYAAFPGEVIRNTENEAKLQRAADSLFGKKIEKDEPKCPVCGGDSFRFLEGNKIKCMLCSNGGTYQVESGKLELDIVKDKHELFLSEKVAQEHKEWLKEMKKRFFEELPELKKIRDKYKNLGEWVRPMNK